MKSGITLFGRVKNAHSVKNIAAVNRKRGWTKQLSENNKAAAIEFFDTNDLSSDIISKLSNILRPDQI